MKRATAYAIVGPRARAYTHTQVHPPTIRIRESIAGENRYATVGFVRFGGGRLTSEGMPK